MFLRTMVICCSLLTASNAVHAEDWPCWRGPRLDGTSLEKNVPLTWNHKDNIAWKTEIPGVGHSSPIVVGDRVFLTTCLLKEEKRVLLCLDRRDGRIVWQRVVVEGPLENKHRLNSHASSTAASDGEHVYVSFARIRPRTDKDKDFPRQPRDTSYLRKDIVSEFVVACYTVDGEQVWHKVPGQFCSRHGFSSSPILYKDKVIVNADQDAQAFLVALDRKTGAEHWRIDRPHRTRSYCVPLIVEAAGKTQMVLSGSMSVASYDPDTGKQLWIIEGPTEQYVASLVENQGLLFMTAGFPTYHNLAIRTDGEGDVTKTHIAWHESKTAAKKASYVPSPIAAGDCFYVISDLGSLSCFEAKSGKRLWMEELGRHHSGSPVLAAGHLYITDDDGITHVVKASRTFEPVARNPLGDPCYSSPAVSGGQLFLRTDKYLWCIGRK